MKRIVLAAKILANDLGYYNLCEYEAHWRVLLELQSHHEPILRLAAVKAIIMASRSVQRTMSSMHLQTELINSLATVVAGEYNHVNKCASVMALAETVAAVCLEDDFQGPIRRHAFNIILSRFLRVYPSDTSCPEFQTMFKQSEFMTAELIKERVVLLHALARFFQLPDTKTAEFISYIDEVLKCLLHPTTHMMLKIAAVHVLATYLPVTNLNRERVEKKFKSAIQIISDPAHLDPPPLVSRRASVVPPPSSESRRASISTRGIFTAGSSEPKSPGSRVSATLKRILATEISKFWSVWFPKVADKDLKMLKSQDAASANLSSGYALRRVQWLSANDLSGVAVNTLLECPVKIPDVNFFKEPWSLKAKALDWMVPEASAISAESKDNVEDTVETPEIEIHSTDFIDGSQLELFIQNKSATEDLAFFLQASPSEFFTVIPSYGIIEKGESCSITLTFTPQPYKPRKNAEIQGFLRIRSEQGLTFERLSLKAYNVPALRVYPKTIDFGFCPKSETRTATVILHSNLGIECPCMALVSESIPDQESPFSVPFSWSQPTLLPKEKKAIKVVFTPTLDGDFKETLYIIAMGGDIYSVNLTGCGGSSIKVLENKIDMGPTDHYYSAVSRRLFLENKDLKNEVPVKFHVSSDEVEINNLNELLLRPGEVRPINVSFLSKFTGLRQETLKIIAPNAIIPPIPVVCASGPIVNIPVMEEVIFPTAITGQTASIFLPIRNISQSHAYLQLSLPQNSPFTIKLVDSETSTLSKNNVDLRSFETAEASGCTVTLSAHVNAVLEIVFKSSTWGTFRVPLTTSATSQVFELDPPIQMCFGSALKAKSDDVWEYVTLTNLAEGELEAFTSIDIPLRVNPKVFAVESNAENLDKVAIGQVTAFDEASGMVSSSIVGTLGDLVTVEVRRGAGTIQFTPVRVMEKSVRKILIRNKTPLEVVWEGKVVAVSLKALEEGTTNTAVAEWCPFGLITSRINLKPYDYATIDIHFQATSSGTYNGRLIMTYVDPVYHIINGEYHRTRAKRDLIPISVKCEVGSAEVEFEMEPINFGDLLNYIPAEKQLTINNRQMIDSKTIMHSSVPFRTKYPLIKVPKESSKPLSIFFQSGKPKFYNSFLWVATDNGTHAVPILANAGYSLLTSNLAEPLPGHLEDKIENEVDDKHHIDFGFVGQCSSKMKVLRLKNMGTFEMTVKNIVVKDNGHLIWKFMDDFDASKALLCGFGEAFWNFKEVDWDEVDYKTQEEKQTSRNTQNPQNEGGKPTGKKKKGSKAVAQSVAANQASNIHKQFPLRIAPLQTLNLAVSFGGAEKGVFSDGIRIDTERGFGETESFRIWGRGNIQPPLTLLDKKVDFGNRAIHSKHVGEIKFKNEGTFALNWSVESKSIRYTPMAKYNPEPLPASLEAIISPVKLFPTRGILAPGATQSMLVHFCPNLAEYEVTNTISLKTEDFDEKDIVVRGIGASSNLVVDRTVVDFGVLRVGTKRVSRIRLHNRGILHTKYFVECNGSSFSADPEEGILEGNGTVDLLVTFKPKRVGRTDSFMKVTPQSEERYKLKPIMISILGVASYPDIMVLTRVVDFGTALYGAENSKPITIENKGLADADIVFSCSHPAISLEGGQYGSVTLPANSKRDIRVIYSPLRIETLDVKVFLRSSDTRGDHFMIQLRGTVGVPKITFQPTSVTKHIDFGVCAVRGNQKRSFIMKNEGNISLSISMKIEVLSITQEENGVSRPISSKTPAFMVEPATAVLPIGEEMKVTVIFSPEKLAYYEYKMVMKYDFRSVSTVLSGLGGRAVFQIVSPLRRLDFGVCRLNRVFRKLITVANTGNLGVKFHIRPEGASRDWDDDLASTELLTRRSIVEYDSTHWVQYLERQGVKILNPDGFCAAQSKEDIVLEYFPQVESAINIRFRVYFANDHEDIDILANAASPQLTLMNSDNESLVSANPSKQATLDLGVHPINLEYISTLKLVNKGPFALDFLIQPIGIREFDIFPLRGYIEPLSSTPLKIFFNPTSESKFQMVLKVLWEGQPLRVGVSGSGGIGKLEVVYVEEKDMHSHCLDFNMVPFNSSSEKRFFLYNVGLVPVDFTATSDNPDYTLAQVGEPFVFQRGGIRSGQKKNIWNWYSSVSVTVLPTMGVELAAKFFSRSPTTVFGHIMVSSDCCDLVVPMRGKGGTFALSHRGDLSFGDIASNYTYSRKITVSNSGSIPANIYLEWLVVGHTGEASSSFMKLSEIYNNIDPRSGFARANFLKENSISDPNYKLTARDHWKLLAKIVRKPEVSTADDMGSSSRLGMGRMGSIDSLGESGASMIALPSGAGSRRPKDRFRTATTESTGRASRLGGNNFAAKKSMNNHFSTMFKRRQMFFHLITSTQVSSQSTALTSAFIRVEPGCCILPSYGEIHLTVDINLSTEDTFLATLLIKSDVANSPPHEVSLTATPKAVSIVCDDTRMLNFYRQPLGEPEILLRTFTNVGHRDINYRLLNTNPALSIMPSRGMLKIGQTQSVQFIFRPVDESIQNADVIFEPDCSQHIRLKMSGGGGFAKASLSKYRRFDFGHCMIGKDTVSLLPITNEGNALLHLTRFDLYETDTFFRGVDWPTSRISLFPGQSYNLALVFNPHEESPSPGKLVIGTNSESWEIELIGLGREAVLIVSKSSLDFTDCLIGNSYERKLGLKNVGDVNYPVTFTLDREFPDLEFIPPSLVINPFSENYVIVSYTPTSSIRSTVAMTVSSPYSNHKIPISLHSGTAILEFTSELLDFGMFERVSRPALKLGIKNTGTVKTSFVVRDSVKPSMFQISGSKGLLQPGKSAEVTVTHIRHTVCEFNEKLVIRSDLIDNFYYVHVKGQCEESLLKPDEFSLLNLGICPVLDATTKTLRFKNYGRYPLDYTVKSTYPLKVFPLSGHIKGGDSAEVSVSWSPSGGYELRTQLTLATNIGNYNVIVRGKAAFPELFIKNVYLDFGVCGVGFPYSEKLVMINKGKVPLHYNIPPMREVSYSVSRPTGYLDLKESIELDVLFKPTAVGRFAHSFIVECKGVSYKEVVVVGIGGVIRLDISPPCVDLGHSPCDLRVYHVITLTNSGEVVLHIDWATLEEPGEPTCTLHLPEPMVIMPGRAARCIFGATAHKIGPLSAKLVVRSKERSFIVPVAGVGVRIILTEKSRRILESEHLPVLMPTGPFGKEITIETVEHWFKLIRRKRLDKDLQIVECITDIMKAARRRETTTPTLKIEEILDQDLGFDEFGGVGKQQQSKPAQEVIIPAGDTHGQSSFIAEIANPSINSSTQSLEPAMSLIDNTSSSAVDISTTSQPVLTENRNPSTASVIESQGMSLNFITDDSAATNLEEVLSDPNIPSSGSTPAADRHS
ncbi:hypothetical protein BDR26DRAFT_935284 [Obelidium mucronatum]|nr:hypothetical protein BDR26DRAFT_935284 [Obelidium mucronatum]